MPRVEPPAGGHVNVEAVASAVRSKDSRVRVAVAEVAVAVAEVRRLDKIVALVGGFLGIPLAFVYPLAVHLRLVPNAPARTRLLSVVAMGVGAVLGLACSAVTVLTWNRS